MRRIRLPISADLCWLTSSRSSLRGQGLSPLMETVPAAFQKVAGRTALRPAHPSFAADHVTGLRRAFTLVEMLLVLALLAIFAGMAMPSVLRLQAQRKLSDAAERVRSVAASARVRAIDSGLVYQFCFEVNGRNFVVVPYEPDHFATSGQAGASTPQNPGVTMSSRVWGELPKGITFGNISYNSSSSLAPATVIAPATPLAMTTTQKIAPSSFDGLPNGGALSNLNWSPPILFSADGSASSDAQWIVKDSRSEQIIMKVRGFTGAVSMERISVGKRS